MEHRVPLSDKALEVLRQEPNRKVNDVVFSGQKAGRPLSNMAFLMMLRRRGRDDFTVHASDLPSEIGQPSAQPWRPRLRKRRWPIQLGTRSRQLTGAATSLKRGAL
jgi:hypothetical protein